MLYRKLLEHDKTEGRHYEAWLDGAAAAYLALGRGREAGYVLLALGRYGDAQRHFPVNDRPLEWAFCAVHLGRRGEARDGPVGDGPGLFPAWRLPRGRGRAGG